MKQKNDTQHYRRIRQGAVALLVAFGFCIGLFAYLLRARDYFFSGLLFYPLYALTQYPPLRYLVMFIGLGALYGLVVFAISRRTMWIALGAVLLTMIGGLLFVMSLLVFESSHVTVYSGASYHGQMYHMIRKTSVNFYGGDRQPYIILKCDASGVMCHQYELVDTDQLAYRMINELQTPTGLIVDPTTDQLKAVIDHWIYPVIPETWEQ